MKLRGQAQPEVIRRFYVVFWMNPFLFLVWITQEHGTQGHGCLYYIPSMPGAMLDYYYIMIRLQCQEHWLNYSKRPAA